MKVTKLVEFNDDEITTLETAGKLFRKFNDAFAENTDYVASADMKNLVQALKDIIEQAAALVEREA